tara:strand:+ start:748 stop:1014 length:267 start_codon:yes stop_codon:yes gene_type:complete
MGNKLRSFAERIYKVVDETDDFYSGVEGIEGILRLIPINIKEGITNTKVDITKEGVVIGPNTDVKPKALFKIKEETDDECLNKSVRNR